jgi:O-antigen ligase
VLKRFEIIAIVLLFISISLLPMPVMEKYYPAVKILLALAFLVFLIKKRARIFKRSDLPLWFFLAAIGINVIFAQHRGIALKTYLDLAIPMFLIYYLVSRCFSSQGRFLLLAKTICILSILVSLWGLLDVFSGSNFLYEHFLPNPFYQRYKAACLMRAISTQFNPSPLGTYLIFCLPFNFMLFRQGKPPFKLLGIIGAVLTCTVIILTFSRTVFLGFVGMILFFLFMMRKRRLIFVFLTSLLVFVWLCSCLPWPVKRIAKEGLILRGDGIFSTYRLDRSVMAMRIVKDYPLTGLGLKHIRIRFSEYYPDKDLASITHYEFRIADNMYLTVLAETGIIGFFAFLIFIFSLFKKGFKQLSVLRDVPLRKQQLLMVLCAFVGLLVAMGGYELFYWPNQYVCFCIAAGFIESFYG